MDDSYVPSLASRALPTSKKAILAESCCTNRDCGVSSSRRLPTSFGGLLGFLGESFENLNCFRTPERERREPPGVSFFQTPYFLGGVVNVQKRIGAIAFQIFMPESNPN